MDPVSLLHWMGSPPKDHQWGDFVINQKLVNWQVCVLVVTDFCCEAFSDSVALIWIYDILSLFLYWAIDCKWWGLNLWLGLVWQLGKNWGEECKNRKGKNNQYMLNKLFLYLGKQQWDCRFGFTGIQFCTLCKVQVCICLTPPINLPYWRPKCLSEGNNYGWCQDSHSLSRALRWFYYQLQGCHAWSFSKFGLDDSFHIIDQHLLPFSSQIWLSIEDNFSWFFFGGETHVFKIYTLDLDLIIILLNVYF